jgi:hypothetical protein
VTRLRSYLWCFLFIGLLVATLAPNAWATPAQNPDRQTIPTRRRTSEPEPSSPAQSTSAPSVPMAPPSTSQPTVTGVPTMATFTPLPSPNRGYATATATRTSPPPPTATATTIRTKSTSDATATPTYALPQAYENRPPGSGLASETPPPDPRSELGGVSLLLGGGGLLVLVGGIVLFLGKRRD